MVAMILGLVVTGCQVYGRVLDLLDNLRPVLLFQSCTWKCLLLVSMLLGDLVQYSHNGSEKIGGRLRIVAAAGCIVTIQARRKHYKTYANCYPLKHKWMTWDNSIRYHASGVPPPRRFLPFFDYVSQIFDSLVHPLKLVQIKNPFGILPTNPQIPWEWVGNIFF